jgi:maleate isomerase
MVEGSIDHKVGLLIPSSDTVMEPDLWRRLPTTISLHVARMFLEATNVAGEEKMLRDELVPAANRLSSIKPELIVFGCTSAAGLHGLEGDAAIAKQVTEIAGCPTITVTQAAIDEINTVQPQGMFLFTPYVPELTERLQHTFQEAGLSIMNTYGLGLDRDLDIAAITPEQIRKVVVKEVHDSGELVDCVFISCTTFRSFEVADEIEKELQVPVITSNKAAFKTILRIMSERHDI